MEGDRKFTLVIDDCQDPDFVAALLKNAGGATGSKRVIYSMRNANASYGHEMFPYPSPFTLRSRDISGKLRSAAEPRSLGFDLPMIFRQPAISALLHAGARCDCQTPFQSMN